jgi:CopG family transcriptional regulator / antitoxin EndoAI
MCLDYTLTMCMIIIMNKLSIQSSKFNRINVTLPKETVNLLDKMSEKRGRSRLINSAVRFYVNEIGKINIKKNLREGALKRKERDIALTEDWFHVEC